MRGVFEHVTTNQILIYNTMQYIKLRNLDTQALNITFKGCLVSDIETIYQHNLLQKGSKTYNHR